MILLLSGLMVAAGWSALWFYAASQAGNQTDAWIAVEHRRGRDWTCPQRSVGGYPFALSIHCTGASYAGQAMGQRVEATFAHVAATVGVADPHTLNVELQPPFSFRTSDGATDVKGTWQEFAIDLAPLPDVRTLALHGTGIAVDGTFGAVGQQAGKADRLDATFALYADQPNPTLGFDVATKGSTVPQLDALLGGSAPVDAALSGRLDHAAIGVARTPEEAMERWRQVGGRVEIEHALASRAGASVSATGTLGLDGLHRLQGRLNAEFLGLGPILARYGISGDLAAVGSLVSALFGGGQPKKAPPAPGAIDLPISFANGRLGIGPVTTSVQLSPLY